MNRVQRWLLRLARVTSINPGRVDDGLVSLGRAGTELDPRWDSLLEDLSEARECVEDKPTGQAPCVVGVFVRVRGWDHTDI